MLKKLFQLEKIKTLLLELDKKAVLNINSENQHLIHHIHYLVSKHRSMIKQMFIL